MAGGERVISWNRIAIGGPKPAVAEAEVRTGSPGMGMGESRNMPVRAASVKRSGCNCLSDNKLIGEKLPRLLFVRYIMPQTSEAPASTMPAPTATGGQPTPPTVPIAPSVNSEFQGPTPANVSYQALREQRSELRNQLSRLEEQRSEITRALRGDPNITGRTVTGSDREGLEARLKEIDARIANTDRQLAEADMAVARASAVPGAVQRDVDPGPPDEVIPIVFIVFVAFPIALAYARRLWRRGATVVAPVPRDVQDRLDQMAQAIEAIAVETERIGEGQRFLTRVMSEQGRTLGAGPMQPVQAGQSVQAEQRVAVPEYRP